MRKIYLLPLCLTLFFGAAFFSSCDVESLNNLPVDPDVLQDVPTDGDTPQEVACTHELFDEEIILEPTCKSEGEKKLTCKNCGFEKTEKIAKVDHDLKAREITLAPTCEGKGESAQICTMCGKKLFVEVLPALGHSMKEESVTPSTCKEEGERILKCEHCDKREREVLLLADHDWEDVEELIAPTCDQDGLSSAVCKVCGIETNQKTIPALGHDLKETLHVDATCLQDGKVERACTRCDYKEAEVLEATGHAFEDKILKQASCTENGRAVSVCKTCGAQGEEKVITAPGHSFSSWKEVLRPSCEADGKEERTCEKCGATEEKTISKTGHNFSDEYTIDKYPTKQEEGEESRHCQNPGCEEKTGARKIEKLEDKTDYSVSLVRTSGESFSVSSPNLKVTIQTSAGEEKVTSKSSISSTSLPTDTYQVKVEGLPKGFQILEKDYTLTPENPALQIVVYSEMIMETTPYTTEYKLWDVIYNEKVTVVELEQKDDHEEYLSELFKGKKAILINMYFKTCPYCIMEMPDLLKAYEATSPGGKRYKDEVLVLLLDYFETTEVVRQMKHQSNFYLPQYKKVENMPITTIHSGWLARYFSKNLAVSFPTTMLIDSEGVIVEKRAGALGENTFKSMMDRGIERYEKSEKWKQEEGVKSAPQTILPAKVEYVSRKKQRYE